MTIQRNGWHLDRLKFDAFMARKATEAGVEVCLNQTVQRFNKSEEGDWTIHFPQKERTLNSKLLVDATGRGASVARQLGVELLRFDRLVGSMAILDAGSMLDRDTLVEAAPNGWWYSALLPGQKMAAAFFTDATIAQELKINTIESWTALLQQAPLTAQRLTALVQKQPFSLKNWPATSQRLKQSIGKDWIAIGDAAAAFDPLSSQGIFYALRSALLAAFAAVDLLAGGHRAPEAIQKYNGNQLAEFIGYWEVRRDFYQMEQRWATHAFWRTRHAALTLSPGDWLEISPQTGVKTRFFSKSDLKAMLDQFPEGAQASDWMLLLKSLRSDLPPGHALEGLQCLVEDGHAQQINASIPSS